MAFDERAKNCGEQRAAAEDLRRGQAAGGKTVGSRRQRGRSSRRGLHGVKRRSISSRHRRKIDDNASIAGDGIPSHANRAGLEDDHRRPSQRPGHRARRAALKEQKWAFVRHHLDLGLVSERQMDEGCRRPDGHRRPAPRARSRSTWRRSASLELHLATVRLDAHDQHHPRHADAQGAPGAFKKMTPTKIAPMAVYLLSTRRKVQGISSQDFRRAHERDRAVQRQACARSARCTIPRAGR